MRNYLGLVFLLLFCGFELNAQPAGWAHTRAIDITENSGTTLSNHQVKLYFDTQTEIGNNQMQANGEDIRFALDCSGNTYLNHWIEGPMNDDSTVIWVKVPSIPASGTVRIYMYYGNPSATSTSAVNGTFIGPNSSTDSVASGGSGGATNSQRGFRFAPNTDLLVTSFGKREPNGSTRYVTLFNYATQAIVAQTQVSGPAAQYSYGSLSNPIWLTSGTQYVLELYQGSTDGYYFGTSSQIGQHLTYYDMRYCNSCTQNTFPTSVLNNYHYGYPDLWYYYKNTATVEPSVSISAPLGSALQVSLAPANGCLGDSVVLGSTLSGGLGATTCLWSPSTGLSSTTDCNPVAIVAGNTWYHLTVTDSLGCSVTDSVELQNGTMSSTVSFDTTTVCPGDSVMVVAAGATQHSWSYAGGLSSSTGDSIYAFALPNAYLTVVSQGNFGCTTTDSFMLNVTNVVIMTPINGANICEGDTATLLVSGADTYVWSPATNLSATTGSSVMAWPSSSITYNILGTDLNSGCTASGTYMVTVHPLPSVSFGLPDPFCDIDPAVLLSSGTPAGGTYSGPGVSNNMFSPGVAGLGSHVITYSYSDSFGCENSDTALAVVEVCIGIVGGLDLDLKVYPNPSTGLVYLAVGPSLENVEYQVMDMMGKVILQDLVQEGQHTLDLTGFSNGTYLLSVRTEKLQKSYHLILKR